MPFPASDIEALKEGKRRRVTKMRFIPDASIASINLDLLSNLAARAGLSNDPEEILLHYRLAERRNNRLVLTLAALLLFGKDPSQWHPRCGIDFVRYEGTERRFGTALNIIKRERLEAPLVRLIEDAYRTVQPHVRERQQLVDLFFEESLEYPSLAWQEAIVNAVAHRDYRYEGLCIEIWMFDDHLEIRSPGELVEPVTLERLRHRERIHASRNPRIVRVLTDAGYMREQGEGVPRMFEAMEHEGLYPPELKIEADTIFNVTLKNTPIYTPETLRWLAQFDPLGLNGNQKRILAYAREHGNTFTSQAYQNLVHVDIYTASRDIKDLIRKKLIKLPQKRGRVYELSPLPLVTEKPTEYSALEPILATKGYVTNEDIRNTLNLAAPAARRVALRLVFLGWLKPQGQVRWRRYFPVH
jgi:ATP-dependent DNA helicase RecG